MILPWTAPAAPDPASLSRMRAHFPRPAHVPPVAWFMGKEQGYLDELARPVAELPAATLEGVLFDMASGTDSFAGTGHVADWREWLLALLPDLAPRLDVHEAAVLAVLVMAGEDLDRVYPGFRRDVLQTLGRGALAPAFWRDGDVTRDLHPWFGSSLSGVLASDVLLHLRHLAPEEFDGWLASVVSLGGAGWRAHWLLLLASLLPPLVKDDPARVLDGPTMPRSAFLLAGHPLGKRDAFLAALRRHFTPDLLASWGAEMKGAITCSERVPAGTDVAATFAGRADEVFEVLF